MKKYLSIMVVLAAMVIGLTSCQQQAAVVDPVSGTYWESTNAGTVHFNNGGYTWATSGKYTYAGNVVSMYVLNTKSYEFVVNGNSAVLKNLAAGTSYTFTKATKKQSEDSGLIPDGFDDIPGLDDFDW